MQSAPRLWMTCCISTALAVLLLVSGGRYAPLPRLGCDPVVSVVSGALASVTTVAAPLRHNGGKQRQRSTSVTGHAASGMAAASRPHLPHPRPALALAPPPRACLPHPRHLRGMLPLSQAPPGSFAASTRVEHC